MNVVILDIIVFNTTAALFACDFERADMCGMIPPEEADVFAWKRMTGRTFTDGTGPDMASHGNYYSFIDSAEELPGDTAT